MELPVEKEDWKVEGKWKKKRNKWKNKKVKLEEINKIINKEHVYEIWFYFDFNLVIRRLNKSATNLQIIIL